MMFVDQAISVLGDLHYVKYDHTGPQAPLCESAVTLYQTIFAQPLGPFYNLLHVIIQLLSYEITFI